MEFIRGYPQSKNTAATDRSKWPEETGVEAKVKAIFSSKNTC
jgi:hypothetical protein